MKPARILTLLFLFAAFTAAAQGGRDAIEEQKRVIAALEKRIADEERAISKIQEGRAATEERVRRLARQLDSRNQLLEETEKQARLLRKEISRTDSVAGDLSSALERNRTQYAEMVREAYRNYKHNNYLTYIFSSRDFTDVAKKITNLREVASMRERKLQDIAALSKQVAEEKELLDRRLTEPVTVSETAAAVGLSASQLTRVFRARFGETPYHYLLGRRLETACLLLRSTALPVREIAFRLCFPDEHYFSSLFHRKLGLTPSDYRKSQGAVRRELPPDLS